MAKQCINCGKKINMGEKSFALANEGKIFCSECGSVAMPLLKSIKICSSPQKYVNIKQSFTEDLKHVNLTDEAKKYIEYEFEDLKKNSPVICEKSHTDGISYEKKKCIGVLGGTFDPIHMGHVSLAYAALKEANLRKLIIMPAYVQPFKLGKRVTDDEFRMAMCKLAFDTNEHIEVSSMEVGRMMVSYTYDTLKSIKEEYPDDQIFFVTGTDSFLQIDTWYKGVQLLKNFSFIVSIRPGYREKELDEKIKYYKESYDTEIIKLTALMPNISATEIRKKIQAGDSVSGLIPESVERYIIKNGLYQGN